MKISITSAGKTWILGDDDSGAAVSGFLLDQERSVQIAGRSRAKYAEAIDRDNRVNTIRWVVDRKHEDYGEALAFVMGHADELPSIGDVEVVQAYRGGRKTLWYKNAVLQKATCLSLEGVSSVFAYVVVAGKAQAKKPT